MAFSAFADKTRPPEAGDLEGVLGAAHAAWRELLDSIAARIPTATTVWGFTSARSGWSLRVLEKKRILLYLTPRGGHFVASFALGEKAVSAAKAAHLPASLLEIVESAPRYAEGRGVRVEVADRALVPPLAALTEIKHRS